jgi:hypothetical protein
MYRRLTVGFAGLCCIAALTACGPADGDADQVMPVQRHGAIEPEPELDAGVEPVDSPSTGALFSAETTSCVESYNPAAVRGRAFAFDGEVVEVGPSVTNRSDGSELAMVGVTFAVREWFSGGGDDTFTVDMLPPDQASEPSSEHGPAYALGSRLLVSGEPRWGGQPLESPIAWTCGFTRYYDQDAAAQWRTAAGR